MYQLLGDVRRQSGRLSTGDRGTAEALTIMRRLAEQGASDGVVRDTAIHVVRNAGGDIRHNPLAQLLALFAFVRDQVLFINDIRGVETLQGPAETLRVGAGDCDDRATLLVALARSIGLPFPLRFRVIAANAAHPGNFTHVYVVARVDGKDLALDPTYRSNGAGYEYPARFRTGEMPA